MTYRVREKLNSKEGATLITALLFFVVCATFGSIVLVAATAASGRLKNLREREQAHYIVMSAAELFCDMMTDEDERVILQIEREEPHNSSVPDTVRYLDPTNLNEPLDITYLVLPSLISQSYPDLGYNSVFPEANSSEKQKRFDINVALNNTVYASAHLTKSLYLTVEFHSHDVFNEPVDPDNVLNDQMMKVTFRPVVKKDEVIIQHQMNDTVTAEDERIATRQKTYTIYWIDPVFE